MASDISASISTRGNVPVTPRPTATAPSANDVAERQAVAHLPGQVVPPVGRPEENAETSSDSSEYDLKEAVSNLNDYVQNLERNLSFSVDEVSGKTVITVTDPESDEVIRQIPSEDLLAVARHYAELRESEGKGVLLEEKV